MFLLNGMVCVVVWTLFDNALVVKMAGSSKCRVFYSSFERFVVFS